MNRYVQGDRVTLRPDRAEAYGVKQGEVYTVLATRPDAHYRKTWVYVAEWDAPCNVVEARELRPWRKP